MRIPRYWTRAYVDDDGREIDAAPDALVAFGWSEQSIEDARRHAIERARNKAEVIRRGDFGRFHEEYGYPGRPLLEQLIKHDADHRWAITRNGYGALVLNCEGVMFLDFDEPIARPPGLFARLFGRRQADPADAPFEDRVHHKLAGVDGLAFRLYRTAGGCRAVATNRLVDADDDATDRLMENLGVDGLYRRLCRNQQCFRARLTPKPWRCGLRQAPRPGYPFRSADEDAEYNRWLDRYDQACTDYSVCRLVGSTGGDDVASEVEPILAIHDLYSCNTSQQLA